MKHDDATDSVAEKAPESATDRGSARRALLWLAAIVAIVVSAILLYGGYLYVSSPAVIRASKLEHYHFRMQVVVNGQPQNFASPHYQAGYATGSCTARLPAQPIHFHDKVDQFTHVHWEGMTGGLVMKNFGWNFIGGPDDALGYQFKGLSLPKKIAIHGQDLPSRPAGDKVFVYTGDQSEFKQRSFADWRDEDLETFFGRTSAFPAHKINQQSRLMQLLAPSVSAEGMGAAGGSNLDEASKERLNNLLGNVVIFVQRDVPSQQQLHARFADLKPLPESACAG